VKNGGNLLTGALGSSLRKEFWKGDAVQGVSVTETCLQEMAYFF